MDKVVLITGASTGIGNACAKYLALKGFKVYGTSRKASIPPKKIDGFELIKMDVNRNESIKAAIDYIIKNDNSIDILINNAGWGISGAIEDTSVEKAKELFETNFFGIHRVIKQVLPHMRKQKNGRIINISSIGGIIGLPYQGFYSSTKFAVEGYSEALRLEVKPFGVKVVIIEPGDIKTSFTGRREKITGLQQKSVYNKYAKRTIKIVEKDEQYGGIQPEKVAYMLYKIINKKNPKVRYKVGSFSQKLFGKLKAIFPDKLIQWILKKYYKTE
jgi:short-subunit dehydrogenase